MPTSGRRSKPPPKTASEFFYRPEGKIKHDADLHDAILDDGDHARAEGVGRSVAQRLGLKPERIEALMSKKK
jgi:hypothetical protein